MDIDTTGFELGMPGHLEMLEHQAHLLMAENDIMREELTKARANIHKLVQINQGLQVQLSAETTRANGEQVLRVQIMNRLRCIHGIDASTWFLEEKQSGIHATQVDQLTRTNDASGRP